MALKSVLSEKVANKDLILVNEIKCEKPQTKKIVEINASPRTTRNTVTLDNDLARIVLKCTPQYDLRVPHFSQKSLCKLHKNAFYN